MTQKSEECHVYNRLLSCSRTETPFSLEHDLFCTSAHHKENIHLISGLHQFRSTSQNSELEEIPHL